MHDHWVASIWHWLWLRIRFRRNVRQNKDASIALVNVNAKQTPVLKHLRNARNQVLAAWKWLLSFRKADWLLDDYPVFIRKQESDGNNSHSRLKLIPYVARIVNWYTLSGGGDTEIDALADLKTNFDTQKEARRRKHEALPRPGTRVPIQFASDTCVEAHRELADDFIKRVLELEWALITDESSLWDFHEDDTNKDLAAKVRDIYGVDISDLQSGRLCDIFERIVREDKRQRWR